MSYEKIIEWLSEELEHGDRWAREPGAGDYETISHCKNVGVHLKQTHIGVKVYIMGRYLNILGRDMDRIHSKIEKILNIAKVSNFDKDMKWMANYLYNSDPLTTDSSDTTIDGSENTIQKSP